MSLGAPGAATRGPTLNVGWRLERVVFALTFQAQLSGGLGSGGLGGGPSRHVPRGESLAVCSQLVCFLLACRKACCLPKGQLRAHGLLRGRDIRNVVWWRANSRFRHGRDARAR